MHTIKVNGMHCAACEMLLERELKHHTQINSVTASLHNHEVRVEINGELDAQLLTELNDLINQYGYSLAIVDGQSESPRLAGLSRRKYLVALGLAAIFTALFLLLQLTGVTDFQFEGTPSLLTFFLLGLVASISTCMAMVGGVVLAVSANYATAGRVSAMSAFHLGRIGGFFVLGALLGFIGSFFRDSIVFQIGVNIVLGVVLFLVALNMLVPGKFGRFQPHLPKKLGQQWEKLQKLPQAIAPALIGAFTFFLPCGYTQLTQAAAIGSGDPLQAGLIMLSFSLGTFPVLALISIGAKRMVNWKYRDIAVLTAGFLILFFAVYNIINVVQVTNLLIS